LIYIHWRDKVSSALIYIHWYDKVSSILIHMFVGHRYSLPLHWSKVACPLWTVLHISENGDVGPSTISSSNFWRVTSGAKRRKRAASVRNVLLIESTSCAFFIHASRKGRYS
jgi:hypothetical protein